MMRRTLCAGLLVASNLQAQSTITGVARNLRNEPLADVEIIVVSPEQRVRSDSAGKFRIGGLAAGEYNLRARRIGYYQATMKLTLAERDTVAIIVELEKRPIMLDTIQVTASCPRFAFAGFACRRRSMGSTDHAFFFDVDAIDSVNPRFPIDMVREVPGLRVVAVRNGLGFQSTLDWKCRVIVLANGKWPSLQNPLPVWPNETIGIEAYPSAKDVPKEYSQFLGIGGSSKNSCGMVNYWTVPRPRRR